VPEDPRDDIEDEDWDDETLDLSRFHIGLEGRTWTVDEWYALSDVLPEKFELIQGKLFWIERHRLGMLAGMLEQLGLVKAVKLAPKELWLEALRLAEE
jgi:hypothetical protein